MYKKEKVLKKLDELNIHYKLIDHPAVYTIDAMDELHLNKNGHIVKNLFFWKIPMVKNIILLY